jgi:N-acetylglucosamine-6-phosphate deacetylase
MAKVITSEKKAFTLVNAKVDEKLVDVFVDGGVTVKVCDAGVSSPVGEIIDIEGKELYSGLFDIHCHGCLALDTMDGHVDDHMARMARYWAENGTTSWLATTMTMDKQSILNALDADRNVKDGCNVPGFHLEGPYINLKYKGAQNPEYVQAPSLEDLEEYKKKGALMITVAPEVEGGYELGEKLKKRGIVASVAHSAASFEQVEEAVKYGYSDITHIYNACTSCFKTGVFRTAGVVEAGLVIDSITTQTIADLRHLPKGVLQLIYKSKGDEKMYLITDGLEFSASDIKENTVYTQENGMSVIYEDNVMKLADRSALAGSASVLSDCVRNMYKTVGAPLYSAVRMASLTPAEVLGISDKKGKIRKGYDADLILFDENINIKSVITNGNRIF